MMPLTAQVHASLARMLRLGDICIDATLGNGHDTLFLAQSVGTSGHVYGLDVQPEALELTRKRLEVAGVSNAQLIQGSHADMESLLPQNILGNVACIMFNLGYLPGGNKCLVTQATTTIAGLEQSMQLLRSGGALSVVAYPGHPGGKDELDAVLQFLSELPAEFSQISSLPEAPAVSAPRWFLVSRK